MSWETGPSFIVCDNCNKRRNIDTFTEDDEAWFTVERTPHAAKKFDSETVKWDKDFCSTTCVAEYFGYKGDGGDE